MPGGKILIVDPDVEGRLPVVKLLRSRGFAVLTAEDAVSAVSVALREEPRIILLELRLPGGDGYQVMKHLKTLPATAATPVIVCTGQTSGGHRERALASGAVGFTAKPVDPEALMSSLRFVLGPGLEMAGQAENESPLTVLVVDDDEDVRRALLLLFKSQGYEVVAAEDAISAMSIARSWRPDVIVLDVGLPGGEGFVVMERLRAVPKLAATPVVVISGREPGRIRQLAEAAGAAAFLEKPTDNRELLRAVRAALSR